MSKFISVNQFCEAVKDLTANSSTIGVYFIESVKSKYYEQQVCVRPIGYTLTNNEGECRFLRYYDVRKVLPETDYIKFNENQDRKVEPDKLQRLMIQVNESETKGYKYHKSKVIKSNDELKSKLIGMMNEDKRRIHTDNAVDDDAFDVCEIDPEFV